MIDKISSSDIYQLGAAKTKSNTESLENFKNILEQEVEDQRLKNACLDLEAVFVQQLMQSMRKTIPESTLVEKSFGQQVYEDMLDEEIANIGSKTGQFGIGEMIYRQLKA